MREKDQQLFNTKAHMVVDQSSNKVMHLKIALCIIGTIQQKMPETAYCLYLLDTNFCLELLCLFKSF